MLSDPRLLRAPLAGALLLALASPVSAGPAPGPEPAPAELDSVEVHGQRVERYAAPRSRSATRTDTALRDVPQAVTVITDGLIRDQGLTGLAETLRLVPGVTVAQGEGNRDTPVLRGNSTTADLFVDGVRDDVQYIRDTYNVERVEVLKGPNAMIFGRGGAGGVVNRVTKVADGGDHRELQVQVGSDDRRRAVIDVGQAIDARSSFRVLGLYEDSESYRDGFELERSGLNPTWTLQATDATTVTLGYEYFRDERVADRGVPSLLRLGIDRPVDVDPATFFGNPELSPVRARVDAFNALVEHRFANGATLRNRTRWADYDKFYQNVFPGAVELQGGVQVVPLSAYNQATTRQNAFNQTDVEFALSTGPVRHTLLAGAEFGRQDNDNRRLTGTFAGSNRVPLSNPRFGGTVTFAPSSTDADNRSDTRFGALYVQDQIAFSRQWQAVLGVRVDRFEVDLRNRRTGERFERTDTLWSPRAGLVWTPVEPLSLYASYGVTHLPRAGEQLASLTAGNATLDPEEFDNVEVGAKWDVRPGLALTAAAYRLERSNVAVADPADVTRSILVDGQRNEGVELGLSGRITDAWSVYAGYAYQEGELTVATSPQVPAGTRLSNLPRHSASLWNRYDVSEAWGVGLGVTYRDEMFAALPGAVGRTVLDDFVRVDAALFWTVNPTLRLQLNVENVLDEAYFVSAHSNDNVTPGSPRAATLTATLRF